MPRVYATNIGEIMMIPSLTGKHMAFTKGKTRTLIHPYLHDMKDITYILTAVLPQNKFTNANSHHPTHTADIRTELA